MELNIRIIRTELNKIKLILGKMVPDVDKVMVINRAYNLFAQFYRSNDYRGFRENDDNLQELQYGMELHFKFLKNEDTMGCLSYSEEEQNLNVEACIGLMDSSSIDSTVNPLLFAFTVFRFLDDVLFISLLSYNRVFILENNNSSPYKHIKLSYGKDNFEVIRLIYEKLQEKKIDVKYEDFISHFSPNLAFKKIRWFSSNSSLIALFTSMFHVDFGVLKGVKVNNYLPRMIIDHFVDSEGMPYKIKSITACIKRDENKVRCDKDFVLLMKKLNSYHKVAD